MLAVTARAGAITDGCMISIAGLNPTGDLRVTHKATIVGDRLADRVALRAVLDSFEVRMSAGELTRRYLSESRHGHHAKHHKNDQSLHHRSGGLSLMRPY